MSSLLEPGFKGECRGWGRASNLCVAPCEDVFDGDGDGRDMSGINPPGSFIFTDTLDDNVSAVS